MREAPRTLLGISALVAVESASSLVERQDLNVGGLEVDDAVRLLYMIARVAAMIRPIRTHAALESLLIGMCGSFFVFCFVVVVVVVIVDYISICIIM